MRLAVESNKILEMKRTCLRVSRLPARVFGDFISPLGTFNDMGDDDPETTFGRVAEKLNGGSNPILAR